MGSGGECFWASKKRWPVMQPQKLPSKPTTAYAGILLDPSWSGWLFACIWILLLIMVLSSSCLGFPNFSRWRPLQGPYRNSMKSQQCHDIAVCCACAFKIWTCFPVRRPPLSTLRKEKQVSLISQALKIDVKQGAESSMASWTSQGIWVNWYPLFTDVLPVVLKYAQENTNS